MIKLSLLGSRLQPINYILTQDSKLQPVTDVVDFTVDQSPLASTSLNSINELGKQLLKAAGDGNIQDVSWLLSQGSPFTSDWLGTSPLHLAAQNNNVDVCEVLIRGGISKDARNKVDRTPLHLAAYEGHYQVAETLIKNGSDVNCKDMLNMTPLHWAVQNGHTAVVELLIRTGAQINVKNKFDLTPQDIAHQINKLEIVELLQAYDGDPQIATQNLVMQLETEGLDNDVVEVQDNSSSSNDAANVIDPVIINLDEHAVTGLEDHSNVADDPVIINLCNDNKEDKQNTNKDPIIINLLNNVGKEIQEDSEKESKIPMLSNKPMNHFKLIDGVIHPVSEETDNEFSAVELLEEHGITMIPNDTEDTNILSTVMESGHSVVLTDVGKEVLDSVKQQEENISVRTAKPKKIITVTPEQYVSITNGQFTKNMTIPGKFKIVPVKPASRRVVMKKNRPIPFGNMIKVQTVVNKSNNNNNKTEVEYYMKELAEAKKTIEEYKTKLRKKEIEVERYKMQLKLLMDPS